MEKLKKKLTFWEKGWMNGQTEKTHRNMRKILLRKLKINSSK